MFRQKPSNVSMTQHGSVTSSHHSSSDDGHIADKWELLMGQDHWEGMLDDPLDMDLRRTIIHYGEMAQATYDTFIRDKYSKYAGSSRFNKNNFFAKVGLDLGHPYKYRVTKFIYATSGVDMPEAFIFKSLWIEPWSKETNFIGFIAVADDESVKLLGRREIVVAWRGSVLFIEWTNNLDIWQVSPSLIFGDNKGDDDVKPEVHQGWYSMYSTENPSSPFDKTSARDQVLTELTKLVEQYKDEEISITVTGHSLGAALATLNAVDIVANKINLPKNTSKLAKPCMVTAIVFASPRVGDANFKKLLSYYDNLRILRVRNAHDLVPNYPIIDYDDVGEELVIETARSTYLKNPRLPSVSHNLEVYLHGVAGTQGSEEEGFKLVIERDVALLNKYFDILRDEYHIPVNWWVQKYKGMVQELDGSWVLMDHEIEDEN